MSVVMGLRGSKNEGKVMETVTHTETLQAVADRQAVLTDYMRDMLTEHGPDAVVVSHTRVTPFGNFLMGIEVTA